MMDIFKRGDKVVMKDGQDATVRETKPDGFYVVKVKGEHTGRSTWGGNLRRKGE